MAINRFSRGPIPADVQSEFIPMPVDLIDRQIQQRQQSYDVTKQFIGEAKDTVYGTQALDVDDENLSNIVSGYDEEIAKTLESVGGDYSRLRGYADALGSKIKKDLHQGQLGAINNNFIKAQTHLKELNELKKEGKIREAGYKKGLASIQAFGGTEDTGDGYASPDLYTPTNYLEIGKVADDYGSKIRDQYDRMGRKYINGQKATELIEQNLWNNPEVVENAREEIWGMYGDLNPQEERVAMNAYMRKIAKDSGYKLQFQQITKPEGEDELTGGSTYSYDLVGSKLAGGVNNLMGTEFTGKVSKMKDLGMIDKAINWLAEGSGTVAMMVDTEKQSKQAQKLATELAQEDIVQDLAQVYNIDLSEPTAETFFEIEDAMEEFNKTTANTRITTVKNDKTAEQFKDQINTGSILALPMIDAETGNKLEPEEKEMIVKTHLDAGDSNEGALVYGGEILEPGQAMPVGTWMGVYNEPGEEGNIRRIFIDANQNKNSMEYLQDRVIAAANSGFASYSLPGGNNVQLLRMPNGSVKQYINGKAAKYPKGHINEGKPITFIPTE